MNNEALHLSKTTNLCKNANHKKYPSQYIISEFVPQGGYHCITNSLKQLFQYYDHPLSEEMLFGIASGIQFTYLNLPSGPFVSGRSNVFRFEENLAKRLNISIQCKRSTSYDKTTRRIKQLIASNNPVLTYVDMYFLNYLNMNGHFGGHSIILFGYDDEKEVFYVSDRDNDDFAISSPKGKIQSNYHLVSYDEFRNARTSQYRPYPTHNKYLEIDFSNYQGITKDNIISSIQVSCANMLDIPNKMNGVNGIRKFSREIKTWDRLDNKIYSHTRITNYFQISADGGTGGGAFRKMYSKFLEEANSYLRNNVVNECAIQLQSISKQWDKLAHGLFKPGHSLGDGMSLINLSKLLEEIAEGEDAVFQNLRNEFPE